MGELSTRLKSHQKLRPIHKFINNEIDIRPVVALTKALQTVDYVGDKAAGEICLESTLPVYGVLFLYFLYLCTDSSLHGPLDASNYNKIIIIIIVRLLLGPFLYVRIENKQKRR